PTLETRAAAPPRAEIPKPAVAQPPAVAPLAPPRIPATVPPGHLYVNSSPWAQVYIDGESVGNTPRTALPIAAGSHVLRVVRDGFLPYERQLQIAPGQEVRLTDLVLSRP